MRTTQTRCASDLKRFGGWTPFSARFTPKHLHMMLVGWARKDHARARELKRLARQSYLCRGESSQILDDASRCRMSGKLFARDAGRLRQLMGNVTRTDWPSAKGEA